MTLVDRARTAAAILRSGTAGRRESLGDLFRRRTTDPGIEKIVECCANWLLKAQEASASSDGGVASHFSFSEGWASSYPETTGYIVPTLLEVSKRSGREDCRTSALRMLEWLESIQNEDGSFQGGNIDAKPCVPVVFNTGQILFGLVCGVEEWGDIHASSAIAAADWLLKNQDSDGAWRKFRSPFNTGGPKAYEAHVAWALLNADRAIAGRGYGDAGMANIRFALNRQADNGWFSECGLGDNEAPITHTIGYALRGVIEGWRHSGDRNILEAACRTADAICHLVRSDGWLAGSFDRNWAPATTSVCVTGSAQLAHCLILLAQSTGQTHYFNIAQRLNRFVRSTIRTVGPCNLVGGVKGSYPVFGSYAPFRLLNWAAKFTIDSNHAERDAITHGLKEEASPRIRQGDSTK